MISISNVLVLFLVIFGCSHPSHPTSLPLLPMALNSICRRAVPPVSLSSLSLMARRKSVVINPLCKSRLPFHHLFSASHSSFRRISSILIPSSDSYYTFKSSICTSYSTWKLACSFQSAIMAGSLAPIPLNTCPVSS